MARTISHSFSELSRETFFLLLAHKTHIFSPPCCYYYILYILIPIWNDNVDAIVRKASKWLHTLRVLRQSGIPGTDLLVIYNSLVRSVLEYACAVWHTSLPQYLSYKIELVQKRAFQIKSYTLALIMWMLWTPLGALVLTREGGKFVLSSVEDYPTQLPTAQTRPCLRHVSLLTGIDCVTITNYYFRNVELIGLRTVLFRRCVMRKLAFGEIISKM